MVKNTYLNKNVNAVSFNLFTLELYIDIIVVSITVNGAYHGIVRDFFKDWYKKKEGS